jgi:hypothetical protein
MKHTKTDVANYGSQLVIVFILLNVGSFFGYSLETETRSIHWAHLSRFHLKTEIESSL